MDLERRYRQLLERHGNGDLDRRGFLGNVGQMALACGVVAPTFMTFARSAHPDRVFGANVAGALLGGIAENASVFLGFQYLLCVAVGFYLLSSAFGNRTLPNTPEATSV